MQICKITSSSTNMALMCCSRQSCILPSQPIIVQAQTTPQLPAFWIRHQVFPRRECWVWHLHLLQSHQASRIWWQVLLELQGVKTPPNHPLHLLLLVSHLILCAEKGRKFTITCPHTDLNNNTYLCNIHALSCQNPPFPLETTVNCLLSTFLFV
jgi:hypothetical protein